MARIWKNHFGKSLEAFKFENKILQRVPFEKTPLHIFLHEQLNIFRRAFGCLN